MFSENHQKGPSPCPPYTYAQVGFLEQRDANVVFDCLLSSLEYTNFKSPASGLPPSIKQNRWDMSVPAVQKKNSDRAREPAKELSGNKCYKMAQEF
jgi:hypothetical protein